MALADPLGTDSDPAAADGAVPPGAVDHHGVQQIWVTPEAWDAVQGALAAYPMALTRVPTAGRIEAGDVAGPGGRSAHEPWHVQR